MTKAEPTERAESIKTKKKIIILVIWLIFLGCPVILIFSHVIQVANLKKAASSIQIGDSQRDVQYFIGRGVDYYSGFPAGGGHATIHYSCYGGSIDYLLFKIDNFIYRIFNRYPPWYHKLQDKKDWPVVIDYDPNDIVIKVTK